MKIINALGIARQKQKEMKEMGIKVLQLNPLEKAAANPSSLRKAITAKCYDCIGQDADPNFRKSIRECVCNDCPLFTVRPYQKTRSVSVAIN